MTTEQVLLVTASVPNPNEKESLAQYGQGAGKLVTQSGGKVLGQFKVAEQIYGDTPAVVIGVVAFPSEAALRGFFNSDEYQALIPAREKGLSSLQIYFSKPGQSIGEMGGEGKSLMVLLANPNPNEQAAMAAYQQGAGPISGRHGAKPVGVVGLAETFYGDSPAGMLGFTEFPNDEAIHAFFGDEEYQPLIPLRDKALDGLNLYIVQ